MVGSRVLRVKLSEGPTQVSVCNLCGHQITWYGATYATPTGYPGHEKAVCVDMPQPDGTDTVELLREHADHHGLPGHQMRWTSEPV